MQRTFTCVAMSGESHEALAAEASGQVLTLGVVGTVVQLQCTLVNVCNTEKQ